MSDPSKTVCVAGASGLVGAHLVKHALGLGYRVHGTLRDPDDEAKTGPLNALPGAAERLTLFRADMATPGAFDEPMAGVDSVLVATLVPTYRGPDGTPAREMDDDQGREHIVKPTVDGALNIVGSAQRAGVGVAVICSSTSSTNPSPPVPVKNEVDHWSDPDVQFRQKKYTSAAKTVMEREVLAFAADHGMRLSIFLPTLMLGPVVIPSHADRGVHAMIKGLLAGGAPIHEKVPDDSVSMIHLEDLAGLFFAAEANPSASGRYFGVLESWPWQNVYAELARQIPEMVSPRPLDGTPSEPTRFDMRRRDSLGVPLRTIPEMLADTIAALRAAD